MNIAEKTAGLLRFAGNAPAVFPMISVLFAAVQPALPMGGQRVGNRAVDTHLKMQMGFILHFHRDLPDLADHIAHFDAAALFHSRFLL